MSSDFLRPCATEITRGAELQAYPLPGWFNAQPVTIDPENYPFRNLDIEKLNELCWIPDFGLVKDCSVIGCHDIWPIYKDENGTVSVLLAYRKEPSTPSSTDEDVGLPHIAVMNGFWWPVGGRIRRIPNNHPDYPDFNWVDSSIAKIREEIGLPVDAISDIFVLGSGQTRFTEDMIYAWLNPATGTKWQQEIKVAKGLDSFNKNYAMFLRRNPLDSELQLNSSISGLLWCSADDFIVHEQIFCRYVKDFLRVIFSQTT